MKSLIPIFLTGLCLLAPAAISAQPAAQSPLLDEAERLWLASKFTDSNTVLEKLLASEPQNADALWRTARNYYGIGENLPLSQKDERYKLYLLVEDYGRKCIKADPESGHCYFWTSVGMGRQGTVKGILTQMRHAKEMRDLWTKAAKIQKQPFRSSNGIYNMPADCYLALGIFYRLTPDWWVAKTILGFRGSIDTSVEYLRKALTFEPDRMEYLKELGVSLLCRGTKFKKPEDIEEGKKYLQRTQTLPIYKAVDKIDKAHAPLLIADPNMACAYSRDGQQEITEKEARKALEKSQ